MPKLVKALGADDRYNLALGVIGYLSRHGETHLDDLAKHFKQSSEVVRAAVSTIWLSSYQEFSGEQRLPFAFDADLLEDDIVAFTDYKIVTEVPRISFSQAAALATGLVYLRNLPEFAEDKELAELIEKFGAPEVNPNPPIYDIKPGTIDESTQKVLTAIHARRPMQVDYTNLAGEESTRVIDPVKLIESEGHVAVLAWCHSANAQRNFRIDRMRRIEIQDAQISPEAIEMFENYDSLSDNPYNASENDHDVVVEVTPEAYALISNFKIIGEPSRLSDSTIRATIKVGRLENLGKLIARYGGAAKVIEPKVARDIVRDYALQALGRDPLIRSDLSVE